MTFVDKLGAIKTYFARGHNQWLIYILWFASNGTIIYVLLGNELDIIQVIFPNIIIFTLVFVPLYAIVAIVIGYFDTKRGTYAMEATIWFKNNPLWRALEQRVAEIDEKVDKILECFENERT